MVTPLQRRDASELDPAVQAAKDEIERAECAAFDCTFAFGRDYFGELPTTYHGLVPDAVIREAWQRLGRRWLREHYKGDIRSRPPYAFRRFGAP